MTTLTILVATMVATCHASVSITINNNTLNNSFITTYNNSNFTTTTPAINTSSEERPNNQSNAFLVFVEMMCIIIFFTGIFGNSLVLLVFGFKWKQLKVKYKHFQRKPWRKFFLLSANQKLLLCRGVQYSRHWHSSKLSIFLLLVLNLFDIFLRCRLITVPVLRFLRSIWWTWRWPTSSAPQSFPWRWCWSWCSSTSCRSVTLDAR